MKLTEFCTTRKGNINDYFYPQLYTIQQMFVQEYSTAGYAAVLFQSV